MILSGDLSIIFSQNFISLILSTNSFNSASTRTDSGSRLKDYKPNFVHFRFQTKPNRLQTCYKPIRPLSSSLHSPGLQTELSGRQDFSGIFYYKKLPLNCTLTKHFLIVFTSWVLRQSISKFNFQGARAEIPAPGQLCLQRLCSKMKIQIVNASRRGIRPLQIPKICIPKFSFNF